MQKSPPCFAKHFTPSGTLESGFPMRRSVRGNTRPGGRIASIPPPIPPREDEPLAPGAGVASRSRTPRAGPDVQAEQELFRADNPDYPKISSFLSNACKQVLWFQTLAGSMQPQASCNQIHPVTRRGGGTARNEGVKAATPRHLPSNLFHAIALRARIQAARGPPFRATIAAGRGTGRSLPGRALASAPGEESPNSAGQCAG